MESRGRCNRQDTRIWVLQFYLWYMWREFFSCSSPPIFLMWVVNPSFSRTCIYCWIIIFQLLFAHSICLLMCGMWNQGWWTRKLLSGRCHLRLIVCSIRHCPHILHLPIHAWTLRDHSQNDNVRQCGGEICFWNLIVMFHVHWNESNLNRPTLHMFYSFSCFRCSF